MKIKKICIFCTKEHKSKRPALCKAKSDILSAYAKKLPMWKIFHAIESGLLPLEAEAQMLLLKRRKAS